MNPVEWLAWIYGKMFRGHPLLGGVVIVLAFAVISGVIGLALWLRAVDKFNEDNPSPKQEAARVNSPTTEPIAAAAQQPNISQPSSHVKRRELPPTSVGEKITGKTTTNVCSPDQDKSTATDVEKRAIVQSLISEFADSHNGEAWTADWINNRLREDCRGFAIIPKRTTITVHGGTFEGNGTAVLNQNPNITYSFDGTNFINNERGIVSTVPPTKENEKSETATPKQQ